MTNTYFEHPAEDTLERYLLHRSDEQEIELVETHTLACDVCVQRLEALELNIAATKMALQEIHSENVAKAHAAHTRPSSWRNWFTAPKLSLAGAALALALVVGVTIPALHQSPVEQVSLSDYRGQESPNVSRDHTLDMHLNGRGISEAEVNVQLVSDNGNQLWHGSAPVRDGQVEVKVPALHSTGAYFVRLYSPGSDQALREFAFNVR